MLTSRVATYCRKPGSWYCNASYAGSDRFSVRREIFVRGECFIELGDVERFDAAHLLVDEPADEHDVGPADLADGVLDPLEHPPASDIRWTRGMVNTASCSIDAIVVRSRSAPPLGNISGR